jgi:proteasome assembly chaperone (PAC2) family protein
MKSIVKLHARPKLREPNMLAAWPGIGNVATIIVNYLKSTLNLKELGNIEASHFFDPIGVLVKDDVVESPQFPQSQFYYYKNEGDGADLILFIGDDQPATKGYDLANCVLDIGERFQVRRVYTCAAAMTRIHHTEPPKVWGVATNHFLAKEMEKYGLEHSSNLQIAGLNGLLLGVAKERGVDGVCLLGEVPAYASRMPNPMAALAVMKVLTTMLEIKVDLAELARMAAEAGERIKQVAAQAMEEYIDYFTEPIWERDDDEEDEEDEDEVN